jgi:Zn-dependent protease/CBS domain-containing protein
MEREGGIGVRVGRIAGFELRIHWSTLFIFGLVVSSLALVQLPEDAPGASDTGYLVAALVAGLAFYGGLLAHEVSHALVARREGIEVDSLTLWLLGGVAALRGEPRTPGADLRIAAAGPAVSLAVAGAAAVTALVLDAAGAPALAVATVGWLAGINAILAVFNLVPAAPLDGGRILRAALWAWRRDRTWAAVAAGRAGEVFGYVLVGLGLLTLLYPGVGGLWFLVLGWFLINAARTEQAQAVLQDALGDIRLFSVMTPDPVTAPAEASVAEILDDYVLRTRHSAFPLRDATGAPAGLVTLGRLRTVPPERRVAVRAADVASPMTEVVTAAPGDRLVDLLPRINASGDGRALVLEGDRIIGLVTSTDVARAVELAGLQSTRSAGVR